MAGHCEGSRLGGGDGGRRSGVDPMPQGPARGAPVTLTILPPHSFAGAEAAKRSR